MGLSLTNNIGAYLRVEPIIASTNAVSLSSDGAPNATEVTGRIVDRFAFTRRYASLKVAVNVQVSSTGVSGALGSATVTTRVLHCATTSGTFAALGSTGVKSIFGTTTTSTSYSAVHIQDVDLRTANRYLQINVLPELVASSSGAYKWGAVGIFGGGDELPSVALGTAVRATTS